VSWNTYSPTCVTIRDTRDEALKPHYKTRRRPSGFALYSQSNWSPSGSHWLDRYKSLSGARSSARKRAYLKRTTQSSSLNVQHVWKACQPSILKDSCRYLYWDQGQNQSRRWSGGANITNPCYRIPKKVRYRPLVDDVVRHRKPELIYMTTTFILKASEHALVPCRSCVKKLRLTLEPWKILSRENEILLWQ
jgi:hypothetical protein